MADIAFYFLLFYNVYQEEEEEDEDGDSEEGEEDSEGEVAKKIPGQFKLCLK